MFRCLLLIVLLTTFPAAGVAAQGGSKSAAQGRAGVNWQFNTRNNRDGNPQSRVFLVVGGRRVFLLSAGAQFNVLERKDYGSHDVPDTAVTACAGWWAGSGVDMYVIRRRGQLVVYVRYPDEQAAASPYKRLKVIPLPR